MLNSVYYPSLKPEASSCHASKELLCQFCGKAFDHSERKRFKHHVQAHKRHQNWRCELCRKGFNSRKHLSEHINTHTGEKPLECPCCEQRFARNSNLRDHIQRWHNRSLSPVKGRLMNPCEDESPDQIPNKVRSQRPSRKNGQRLSPRKSLPSLSFKCTQCSYVTPNRRNLVAHLKLHYKKGDFGCAYCSYTHATSKYVKQHQKQVHPNVEPRVTRLIQQNFRLESHMYDQIDSDGKVVRNPDAHVSKPLRTLVLVPLSDKESSEEDSKMSPPDCVASSFNVEPKLEIVRLKVDNVLRYVCALCRFFTKHKPNVYRHVHSHSTGKVSSRVVTSPAELQFWTTFIQVHSQDHVQKAYVCPMCPSWSLDSTSASLHIASLHQSHSPPLWFRFPPCVDLETMFCPYVLLS